VNARIAVARGHGRDQGPGRHRLLLERTGARLEPLALDLVGDETGEHVQELEARYPSEGWASWLAAHSVPYSSPSEKVSGTEANAPTSYSLVMGVEAVRSSPRTSGIRFGRRPSSTRWQ
jgi:hypothetical protein